MFKERGVYRKRSQRAPVDSEVLPNVSAAPCLCLGIVFLLARRKTSVSYLNGTLYWRSPELVSSLFNFRKWCHNALNNSAGWFIFPWTCCPKHSSSLAVFPIDCKLECSSYFIMILRGEGGRAGLEREESFQGLLRFRANDTSIVSLLGLEVWSPVASWNTVG